LTASVALDTAREFFTFCNIRMKYVVESGEFEIMVGDSARDFDLQKVTPTVMK
jgi:beta-glucosidase